LEDAGSGEADGAPLLPARALDGDESAGARSASHAKIRVDVALLDRLMDLVGELVLARNQVVQECMHSESATAGGPVQRLRLVTSELQDAVLKTRMQPIGQLWSRFPRMVRDL